MTQIPQLNFNQFLSFANYYQEILHGTIQIILDEELDKKRPSSSGQIDQT